MSPVWLGDVPSWITTLAVGFAAYQLLIDRRRRGIEEDRESKGQARKISAWAASDCEPDARTYGVVVSNRSDSTVHEVSVSAFVHDAESPKAHVVFTVLPPGDYYVQLVDEEWAFPMELAEYGRPLRPYTRTARYRVSTLTFTDNLNQKWEADDHMVLNRR